MCARIVLIPVGVQHAGSYPLVMWVLRGCCVFQGTLYRSCLDEQGWHVSTGVLSEEVCGDSEVGVFAFVLHAGWRVRE